MKKKFWAACAAVLLAAAMALTFAGCGGEQAAATPVDAESLLEEVSKKQEDLDAVSGSLEVRFGMTNSLTSAQSVNVNLTMDFTVKQEPVQMAFEVSGTSSANGTVNDTSAKMYMVPDGEDFTFYAGAQDTDTKKMTWSKATVTKEQLAEAKDNMTKTMGQMMDPEKMEEFQNSLKKIMEQTELQNTGTEQVGAVNAQVFEGQLSMLDMMEWMQNFQSSGVENLGGLGSTMQNLDDMPDEMKEVYNQPAKIRLLIDPEAKRVVKIAFDFKDTYQAIMQKVMESMANSVNSGASIDLSQVITVDAGEISMTLQAVGDDVADVVVPDDVKANAKENTSGLTLTSQTGLRASAA